MGGISLGTYSLAIEAGNPLKVGHSFRQDLESFFKLPVKYLFLTHAHSDHRNGMDAFKDTILLISQKCKDNMPKNTRFAVWNIETFEDKFILEEKNLLVEFHHVGGHSLGSSVAYVPSERVLFAGDLFFEETINLGMPFLGFYQSSPRKTANPEEYLKAFESFKSMKLDYIVPGHGNVITNPQEYLEEQKEFFNSLKSFIITEINNGKALEEVEFPRFGPIERAYEILETKSQKSKGMKFMDTILDWLKKAFYTYYSENM
jgi:glyoxylase-like metal-dependent hydrolase (beta-lactamase superfamily II)